MGSGKVSLYEPNKENLRAMANTVQASPHSSLVQALILPYSYIIPLSSHSRHDLGDNMDKGIEPMGQGSRTGM